MTATVTLSVDVPVIETERLILREPTLQDFDAYADFAASDRTAYVGGKLTRYEAWRKYIGFVGHWVLRGYGYWTITEKATGAIIGRTGVGYHEGEWPEPELGWTLQDGCEGKGYAFEAAVAARAQAAQMGLGPLISLIDPDNARSRRLAERMGATVEREMTLLGDRAIVYRHPASSGPATGGAA
ncbi:MAG: N-acetyltransferase [Paracoccus denitrificans]|nr:MAG: N-acetyltransferase [Paracoccus denitrificans]PZO85893.1 MAG: N-acetyltransferase [Paracoccus denitrificans]